MITLSFIAYVIISLLIARHRYWDYQFEGKNPCYLNGKKSLRYGFLFLPVLILGIYFTVMFLLGLGHICASTVGWIVKNMP